MLKTGYSQFYALATKNFRNESYVSPCLHVRMQQTANRQTYFHYTYLNLSIWITIEQNERTLHNKTYMRFLQASWTKLAKYLTPEKGFE
jgi:hypothetical protein